MNYLGISNEDRNRTAKALNSLLANYHIYYQNLRAFHWHVSGENFFDLHEHFEALYNDARQKIDEIAERVLTLGYTPAHSFSEYLKKSKIKEAINISGGNEAVRDILNAFAILLPIEREILALSAETDDEGTNALMSDYIREQEKLVWMYSAFLNEK